MINRKCPVCGSEQHTVIYKVKMGIPDSYQLPKKYNVVSCEVCGFCFADTEAKQENYDYYYTHYNTYSGTPVDANSGSGMSKIVEQMLDTYFTADDELLDMGFGNGNFLRYLKGKGYRKIWGIDPSGQSVENICKFGISARVGSVLDEPANSEQERFKCIFLFDVLEHLLEPQAAICNLKKYLCKDGYLLISVPNYAGLQCNNYPISNVFNQEHINYFSLTSLDNLMFKCGFVRQMINVQAVDVEEIVALYQSATNSINTTKKDTMCVVSIEEYLQRFLKRRKDIEQKIENLEKQGIRKLYVWGTGSYTMWLLANTDLAKYEICFIDNNETKIGQNFQGCKIISPMQIEDNDRTIVICSMLYSDVIETQIRNMGLMNEIVKL